MGVGHIFVSYTSSDKPFADELVGTLQRSGLRIWYAPRDVRPGIDYSEQIQKAIETANAFVVIISDSANRSDFVRAETEMAFSRRRPIFPVRTSPAPPAPGLALFLQLRHWTDAFGPGRQNAIARLAVELAATAQPRPRGSRRGPTLFRPRQHRLAGAAPPAADGRSRLPLALIAMGAGALVLALILAVPGGSPANVQASEATAEIVSDDRADHASARPAEPNYAPLLENWMDHIRETAPPPLIDEFMDNALDMAADYAVENAADAVAEAADPAVVEGAEVNGM